MPFGGSLNQGKGLGRGKTGKGRGSGDKSKPKVPVHGPPKAREINQERNVVHPRLKKLSGFKDRGYLSGRGTF